MQISPKVQAYLNEIFGLCESLIVKSSLVANAINDWVQANTGIEPDPTDPSTWKYYINLSGNYSPYDQPMYIYSLDSGNQILFSSANLQTNPVTLANYYPGSFFYQQLINEYPLQQDLILSIIYPVNIETAINAADGTILNYNTSLVEPQEYTLMSDLQTWVSGFHVRWNVAEYAISDSLYPAAQRGVFFNSIVPKLINLRFLRCKTIEAHSFHIREYLSSHNNLAQYIEYLTLEQQLYLYRNISSFQRHSGFKSVFTNLITYLATPNNILLGGLNLRKTNTIVDNNPVSLFYIEDLSGTLSPLQNNNFTLTETLALETPLAPNNSYYINKDLDKITDLTQYTLQNNYITKIIYSNNLQNPNPYTFNIYEVMYNELLYLSYTNQYSAIALVQLINGKYLYLNSMDAVYLLAYLAAQIVNVQLTYLPTLKPIKVLNPTVPTYEQASSYIAYDNYKWYNLQSIYNDTLSILPKIGDMDNIVLFNNYATQIYNAMASMNLYTASINNANDRAFMENFFRSFFSDYVFPPTDTNTYAIWLSNRYIDLSTYTRSDLIQLYISVFLSITNYNIQTQDEFSNSIQAILSIFKELTSYTLQYITDITSQILSLDEKAIRIYNPITTYNNYVEVYIGNMFGIEVPKFQDRVTNQFYNEYSFDSGVQFSVNEPLDNLSVLSTADINTLIPYVPAS